MLNKNIMSFLTENSKFLAQLLVGLLVLYIFLYFITPKVELSKEDGKKLQELDYKIQQVYSEQKKIDENISRFTYEIETIQDSILRLKKQRDIIQNFYDEKEIIISKFDDKQLDSFFTNRYGYSQNDVFSGTGGKTDSK